jgi:hypothetical protein
MAKEILEHVGALKGSPDRVKVNWVFAKDAALLPQSVNLHQAQFAVCLEDEAGVEQLVIPRAFWMFLNL